MFLVQMDLVVQAQVQLMVEMVELVEVKEVEV